MITFAKRNLKLFFRDKSAVFFSLLAVFIVIGLYALFLGDVWMDSVKDIEGARFLMDSWVVSGLLTVASVTTTLGAFGIMVQDKVNKISKDFYVSPIKRSSITAGYLFSAFCIGVIMSIVTLIVGQAYILMNGGILLGIEATIKVFGIILISSIMNTAFLCFLVSFFNSQSAFATASTILGTLIGFVAGVYLPIGSLPSAVQSALKLFPVSHAATLFRKVMMQEAISKSFAGIPSEYLIGFKEEMGVVFKMGNHSISTGTSILILAGSTVLFFVLANINMSRKAKQ